MMNLIDKTLDTLLCVILAAMVSTMAANVFCRFFRDFSLYWADELAQVLMVWLTFLGAAVAIREGAHYSFDTLSRCLRGRPKFCFMLSGKLLTLLAVTLLLYWSLETTLGIRSWIMPAMEFSRAWVYGACPVGCVFMLIYGLRDLSCFLKK